MRFLERIRQRRRQRFFAAKIKLHRQARDEFNCMFDRGLKAGRYSLAPVVYGFGYYLAVRNEKKLRRWDLAAKFATMHVGLNALNAYDQRDARMGSDVAKDGAA